ncbi:MAG: hypothetical protein ABSF83_14325, partial [Nitrososphaerales archaeon]
AAVIIHVLHVVVDWATVMREVGRVTRGPVLSILRVPLSPPDPPGPAVDRTAAPAQGRPVRTQHRMWQNELELKARVPPRRLERLRDETVSIPVADAIRRVHAKRAMGSQLVPPEIERQMLERIVTMTGAQSVQRRIVEDLAVWAAEDLRSLGV